MKQFLPVEIEITYFTTQDVITASGVTPTTDDQADVVQAWKGDWN